jgi:hypothetical protein
LNWTIRFPFFGFCHNTFFKEQGHQPVSNAQSGGSGLCIYVLQWQNGLLISLGNLFLFLHHLQFVGLQWRYSNQIPQAEKKKTRS